MNVYYLGRENQPGVKKYTDYYFVEKRTGKFLVKKHANRSTEKFLLHRNGVSLMVTPTETEVVYSNMKNEPCRSEIITQPIILEYINTKYFNIMETEYKPGDEIITYRTRDNTKIEGTINAIFDICKRLGETVDISKLSSFDKSKYYYSVSKEQWIPIKEMNSAHIMNSVAKKIRDYFQELKVAKTDSVPEFLEKLELWTNDQIIKSLVDELTTRV